jgi:putative transposase
MAETRDPSGDVDPLGSGNPAHVLAFTHRAKASGLVPSMGSIGDCYDNAVIEVFWSRMQVELLDRQTWRTGVELANGIFLYLEVFHNRKRVTASSGCSRRSSSMHGK